MMEKQPPKQIYLQAYDSDSYDDNTWCQDKITDDDIEYILQSEYNQLKSENDKLRAENERLREALREIIALDDGNSILKYYERYYQVFRLARQALKEVKE